MRISCIHTDASLDPDSTVTIEGCAAHYLAKVLRLRTGDPLDGGSVSILIGPEGGFSETEIKQLQLAGVKPVGLGSRVLRTEIAGPAAIAVLQALHGDL